ncbi:unnamed protein product [Orchesella dallaii]|uniref:Phage tail protein n=1 Tax=Orchesella dallaii TaxID=48710 RepID=A0ABP1PT37_9HEXA
MTSSANKINQLTTDVNVFQQTVVPDINGRIDSLQQQVGGVSQALSSLRSVAITEIKLSPIEYSTIWKGPGYNDQVGYVITEVSNFNRDEYLDTAGRRKLIKMVNGNWHNVGA